MKIESKPRNVVVAVALIGIVVLARHLFVGSSAAPKNKMAAQFTCCSMKDLNRTYRPGETVRIHWIATYAQDGTGQPYPITLTARLVGSFKSPRDMKRHPTPTAIGLTSSAIHVTEQSFGPAPVSVFRLPNNTSPGIYGLVWRTSEDGSDVSAATSIKVAAS